MEDTVDTLFWKVFSTIACSFAGRISEVTYMNYEALEKLEMSTGPAYIIHFTRLKGTGTATTGEMIISGKKEVASIDKWVNAFPPEQRTGRLFKYIKMDKNGKFVPKGKSNNQIGKHACELVGKKIAKALKLPNWNGYTSHCWRRSSITWMADHGLTIAQIKAITNHKSDTVLQGYIDNSVVMKEIGASAISLASSKLGKRKRDAIDSTGGDPEVIRDSSSRVCSVVYNVSLTGNTINGTMNLATNGNQ